MSVLRLFVDTSAWVALEDRDDSQHDRAIQFWTELKEGKTRFRQLLTSNYVLDEVITLLGRRVDKEACAEFWRKVRTTKVIDVLRVEEETELNAFDIYIKGPEDLSYTDSTSFALMRQEVIDTCFTFDRHFSDIGFDIVPM